MQVLDISYILTRHTTHFSPTITKHGWITRILPKQHLIIRDSNTVDKAEKSEENLKEKNYWKQIKVWNRYLQKGL